MTPEQHEQLEVYRGKNQYNISMLNTVITAGQSALKANIFLNAGAAVAILAFFANVLDEISHEFAQKIIISIGLYGIGALAGSVATGFTYFAQYAWAESKYHVGVTVNLISNVLVTVAYNLFAIASFVLLSAFALQFNLVVSLGWFVFCTVMVNIAVLGLGILVFRKSDKR